MASCDTPHAHFALGGDGPLVLFSSGAFAASFPDPFTSEGLAHLAGSLAESPRRILATPEIALGPLRFLLLHGPERVDLVEPDPRALAFLRSRLHRLGSLRRRLLLPLCPAAEFPHDLLKGILRLLHGRFVCMQLFRILLLR